MARLGVSMNADELFKELGYERIKCKIYIEYKRELESYKCSIKFDYNSKSFSKREYIFTPHDRENWSTQEFENDWLKHSAKQGKWDILLNIIDMNELEAINQQCKELGWK